MAISVENYLLCCRICLELDKSDYFLDIYSTELPGTTVKVQEALQKTTGVQCDWDGHLPSKICQSCQLRLQDAFNFITEFSNSNTLLEIVKQEAFNQLAQVNRIDAKEVEKEVPEIPEHPQSEVASPSVKEMLQIERLETPNENYVIFELDTQSEPKIEPDQDTTTFDESSSEEAEEHEMDAVDFILRNLQTAANQEKRKKHISTARRYQCQVCDKAFQRKSNLVDHLRLHANVKLFACSYCNASFVQAGNLKSHIRRHTLEKPFKCQFCDKSYSQSSALKTHIRTHTNERDYVCDICLKGFTNSSDLGKHKITHSDLRFYQCVVCVNRYFTQKVHLKKHLKSFHHNSNFEELLEQGTLKKGVRVTAEGKAADAKA